MGKNFKRRSNYKTFTKQIKYLSKKGLSPKIVRRVLKLSYCEKAVPKINVLLIF